MAIHRHFSMAIDTSERFGLHAWSRHRSQSIRTPDALARTDTGPSLPLADADQPPVAPRSDRDGARPTTPSGRAHRSAATATAVPAKRGPRAAPPPAAPGARAGARAQAQGHAARLPAAARWGATAPRRSIARTILGEGPGGPAPLCGRRRGDRRPRGDASGEQVADTASADAKRAARPRPPRSSA